MGAVYPDLAGRGVLVTGGASGIGAAIVQAFAAQGARVGFIDLDLGAGERLSAQLSATGATSAFAHADLRDIDALKAAVSSIRGVVGPITVLVNNAARDDRHTTDEVTPEYFDERIATNLRHQFFATQAVLPDMREAGGGSVICMSSIVPLVGVGGIPVYSAAKSAVIGLMRSLARDHGGENIRVNAISPGWIMTERQLSLWLTPEADAMRADRQCLARRLLPEDVARVALFLASDESVGITAQNHVVDGGWA